MPTMIPQRKTLGSAIQKMKTGQNESGIEGALDSTEGGINSMEGSINSTVTPTVEDLVTEDAMQKTAAMWILKAREEHRIPLSVMDAMMGDFQSLQVAMEACRHQVEIHLVPYNIAVCTQYSVKVFEGLVLMFRLHIDW